MISREGPNSYYIHTIGGEISEYVNGWDLHVRLRGIVIDGQYIWSQEQIKNVLTMDIGDSTPRPQGRWS